MIHINLHDMGRQAPIDAYTSLVIRCRSQAGLLSLTRAHFAEAADQSYRLEEGCSSARRVPSSYNDNSSFPQQSAGYAFVLNNTGVAGKAISGHLGKIETASKPIGGDRLFHGF